MIGAGREAARKLTKALRLLRRPGYRVAMRHRVAAAIEHECVLRGRDFRTIVDIGANRGQFAVVAHELFPHARLFAFEPLEAPARTLERLMSGNGRVQVFQAAIGPERTTATMHVAQSDHSSSLLPITPLQERISPGTSEAGRAEVVVAPLDAFLGRDDLAPPGLLKIDVQGYELEALKGCASLLPRFETVYVECSFLPLYEGQAMAGDVIAHLLARGLALTGVHNLAYLPDGTTVQGDFLFVRSAETGRD